MNKVRRFFCISFGALAVSLLMTWIISAVYFVRLDFDEPTFAIGDGVIGGSNFTLNQRGFHFGRSEQFNLLGLYHVEHFTDRAIWQVYIPIWALVLPFAAAWWLLRQRKRPGLCRTCRYDLTGNTTGRCPECGAAFAPAARPPR